MYGEYIRTLNQTVGGSPLRHILYGDILIDPCTNETLHEWTAPLQASGSEEIDRGEVVLIGDKHCRDSFPSLGDCFRPVSFLEPRASRSVRAGSTSIDRELYVDDAGLQRLSLQGSYKELRF